MARKGDRKERGASVYNRKHIVGQRRFILNIMIVKMILKLNMCNSYFLDRSN
jgi:hypothetical protein